jgi:histidyl-tRNA synthetase
LGGIDTPAFGCAIGVDRVVELLKQSQTSPSGKQVDFCVVATGNTAQLQGLLLAQKLRSKYSVELNLDNKRIESRLKESYKLNTKVLIIGEEQAYNNTVIFKSPKMQGKILLTQADFLRNFECQNQIKTCRQVDVLTQSLCCNTVTNVV